MEDTEFKEAFWIWFDKLPAKAKHSYHNAHLDVAEAYFRDFFWKPQPVEQDDSFYYEG